MSEEEIKILVAQIRARHFECNGKKKDSEIYANGFETGLRTCLAKFKLVK